MNQLVKLTFISGLKDTVLEEIRHQKLSIVSESESAIYLELPENIKSVLSMKSIASAYLAIRDDRFNPKYINKHKSLIGNMIDLVLRERKKSFATFRIRCAGSQSDEVLEIEKYIQDTYKLSKASDASLEIYISKIGMTWEISARLSPLPLSVREYKVSNIKGGLNPNIAYAMNSFCNLESIESYLNMFSGSATLLIEAGLINPKLKMIGIDKDKKTNSLAIQNLKKAQLIKNIQIKTADIFESPDFGTFDAITCNLPFGMQISKGENLKKVYQQVVDYAQEKLNANGTFVLYTTEHEILENILMNSKFQTRATLELIIPTNVNSYLTPKIFVCNLL